MWQPIVLNGLYSMQPGIDWLCHLGGGLIGGALMALVVWRLARRDELPSLRRISVVLAGVVCVLGSFAAAWAQGRPWEMSAPPRMERQWLGVMGLSLDVPHGFVSARDGESVAFGTLDHDPLLIEVRFVPQEKPATPDELAAARAALRNSFTSHPPEGVSVVSALREETIGALQTMSIDGKYDNGVTTRSWGVVLPEGAVVLRVYLLPNTPAPWVALRDSFIRSLRTKGAQTD